MTTHIDNHARTKRQRLAELEQETAELERRLVDARRSLDQEMARAAEAAWAPSPKQTAHPRRPARDNGRRDGYAQAAFEPDDFGQDGPGQDDFGPDDYREDEYGQDVYDGDDDRGDAEFGSDGFGPDEMAQQAGGTPDFAPHDAAVSGVGDGLSYPDDGAYPGAAPSVQDAAPVPLDGYATATPRGHVYAPEARTAILINHGRASAPRRLSRGHKLVGGVVAGVALLITIVVMALPGPGPTWPASVARVQGEIAKACQNPDVRSEPGQVNFACARSTRQILWVFSLLTSGNNPNFAEASSGRVGLEPITPTQGGAVATSLNLHHPYQPSNPVDSLEVAARAINDIIGGATVTGTYGNTIVQAGLESTSPDCLRYTGSPKVTRHKGFPGLCARPVSSTAGQAVLVADVFQRWVVGAPPKAAQNAAILYENARNPGSPQVQAILKHLPNSGR